MTKYVTCASTGTRMSEDLAREVDEMTRGLPQGCGYRTKAVEPDAILFEPSERAEVSIISSDCVDRSNEVVIPQGVDLTSYRKNSVVLWSHDWDRPVGTCEWVKIHKNTLRAKTIYPEDASHLSQEVWKMLRCTPPVLKAKSIGFLPRTPARAATPEELVSHPEWREASIFDDTLLLEYSCVSVGCNQDSLLQMVNTKSLDAPTLADMGIQIPETPETHEVVHEVARAVRETHMPLDQAVAYVLRMRKHKKIDLDRIFARSLGEIDLDVAEIVRRALDAHVNRGRV